MTPPPASIVIPTRGRPSYLEVALASIAPQAKTLGAEVLVLDDAGPSHSIRALAERFDARYEPHPAPLGLNVARNTGVERSSGALVVFVDDDVRALPGWLDELLHAAASYPQVEVFTGPIRPVLDGAAPRSCGREGAPITSLDLGAVDTDAPFAWGANMAIRRRALDRVGRFDASLTDGGDEQEWQERLNGRVLYVAGAAVEHRRVGTDAHLRSLARGARVRGRAARRFDCRRGAAPSRVHELLTLAGCVGHVLRRRCPAGLVMVAHSVGRLEQALHVGAGSRGRMDPCARIGRARLVAGAHPSPTEEAPSEDFLSGESGAVGGVDAVLRRIHDEAANAWELTSGQRLRLALAARRAPPTRNVLVLGIERPERRALAAGIRKELLRSRHRVEAHTSSAPGDRGKFENLNLLLRDHPPAGYDWLLVVDDDVELPRGFLDRFLFLCERFSLQLAQPAHRLDSHAAWRVTRRHPGSVVRETRFVEIGPVTAFARSTFPVLLPFPELRMGWGLDLHWAALAREHGWRCGVLDAVSIRHRAAPAADAYSREAAVAEARAFLAERPYLSAEEAQGTLATHGGW